MFTVSCPNCAATYNLDEAKVGPQGRKLKCAKCAHVWVAMAPAAAVPPVVEPVAAPVAVPAVEEVKPTRAEAAAEVAAEVKEAVASAAAEPGTPVAVPDPSALDEHLPDFDFKLPDIDHMAGVGRMGGLRALAGGEKWLWLALILCVVGILGGVWSLLGGGAKPAQSDADEIGSKVAAVSDTAPVEAAKQVTTAPEGLQLRDVKAEFVTGDKAGVTFEVKGSLKNTTSATMVLPGVQVELVDKKGEVADVWPVKLTRSSIAGGGELSWGVSFTNPPTEEMAGWRAVFVK